MEVLPGEILEPDWQYQRCLKCGRALSAAGEFRICEDAGYAHFDFEMIPPEKVTAFHVQRAWSNVLRMKGDSGSGLLDAIEWMTAGRKGSRPVDKLRDGQGAAVLEKQYEEWPRLKRELEALKQMQAA